MVEILLYAEQGRECPRLTSQIAPRNPENLPLPNHLCRLDPLNRSPRRRWRSWPLHATKSAFDVPVIGLDPVIRVAPGSLLASAIHMTFLLQFADGGRVAAQTVPRENVEGAIVRIRHRPLEEGLRGFTITRFDR